MRKCLVILVSFLFVACAHSRDKPGVRVAVYVDVGTRASKNVLHVLASFSDFTAEPISAQDIRDGKLKNYRILIVPGGSPSIEAEALEEKGCDQIKTFVREGGQYIGICAGAYLATNDYTWSLGILNAKVVDREHSKRGHGAVRISFTPRGKEVLALKEDQTEIAYWQGPLLAPGDSKDVAPFEALARFDTEIAENGAPKGVMKGTVAIAAGTFGKGHVVCFSPHPEKTEPTYHLLKAALQWLK